MENINLAYIWLTIFIVFAIIEIATPQFVTIWFALGSLIALPLALLGIPVYIQISVFAVVSVILLFATRPLYKKYIKTRHISTNADALIGATAIVLEQINNDDAVGIVKAKGQIWSARAKNGEIIDIGEKVIVESIEGVKLIVSKYIEK